jgi:hypothetical protein
MMTKLYLIEHAPGAEAVICNNMYFRWGICMASPQDVEWVKISRSRRIGYGLGAILFLSIFVALVLFTIQAGKFGMLDAGIMGATLAGGGFAAYCAVTGKERQPVDRK